MRNGKLDRLTYCQCPAVAVYIERMELVSTCLAYSFAWMFKFTKANEFRVINIFESKEATRESALRLTIEPFIDPDMKKFTYPSAKDGGFAQ